MPEEQIQASEAPIATPALTVRDATLKDVPAVVRLAAEVAAASHLATCLKLDRGRIADTMRALVDGPSGVLLVVVDGDRVIGAAAGGVCRHWWSYDLVLAGMFLIVEPGSRGEGAAPALAAALRGAAEAHRATYVCWCSTDGSTAEDGGAVFERAGMRPIGRMFEMTLREPQPAAQATATH